MSPWCGPISAYQRIDASYTDIDIGNSVCRRKLHRCTYRRLGVSAQVTLIFILVYWLIGASYTDIHIGVVAYRHTIGAMRSHIDIGLLAYRRNSLL